MPRTRTVEQTVYQFHELSDRAKGRVRQWLWEGDYDWWDGVYEDFKIVAAALGFETHTDRREGINPHTKAKYVVHDDRIWFNTYYCTTAGFDATWRAAGVSREKLTEHIQDETLDALATTLEAALAQVTVAFGTGFAERNGCIDIKGSERGVSCQDIEWDDAPFDLLDDPQAAAIDALAAAVESVARDLARWLAKALDAEAEYRQSDDCVQETCEANEYAFDESGRIL